MGLKYQGWSMYHVGWNKQEIKIEPTGYAMFGYGMWTHRATTKRTALYARSFSIQDASGQRLLLCCVDLGCITYAMRQGVVQQLQQQLGTAFQESYFALMATHTHSAPGGCGFEALYNMPTPGFVPEYLQAIVNSIVESVVQAIASAQDTEIRMTSTAFLPETPVAWNRSLQAYNRNTDVEQKTEQQTHLAIQREMQLLGFYRQGKLQSFISFFGVHATCLGNTLNAHDGDNKGYAAAFAEQQLLQLTQSDDAIAIFAQATAGDVSPHFHGENQLKIRQKIKGEQEYLYAQKNGQYQAEQALQALNIENTQLIEGSIDAILMYSDLANVEISPEFAFGQLRQKTSQPCHGVPFFAGTPVDGLGAPKAIIHIMHLASKALRIKRLKNTTSAEYEKHKALYASQGVKNIVIEAGDHRLLGKSLDVVPSIFDPVIAEMNRQYKAGAIKESLLVPQVIPLQIIKIGRLSLICCAGEITTVAGARLVQTVKQQLSTSVDQVWLASYCNDYMGYITTYEEYQQQAYEGGHTLYGQWTHAAFQTGYQQLAQQFNIPQEQRHYDAVTRPKDVIKAELDLRTNRGNSKTAVTQN